MVGDRLIGVSMFFFAERSNFCPSLMGRAAPDVTAIPSLSVLVRSQLARCNAQLPEVQSVYMFTACRQKVRSISMLKLLVGSGVTQLGLSALS